MSVKRFEVISSINSTKFEPLIHSAKEYYNLEIQGLTSSSYYLVEGDNVYKDDFVNVSKEIFCDSVVEEIIISEKDYEMVDFDYVAQVSFLAGVTDNPGRSAENAYALFNESVKIYSGELFYIKGQGARKVICNFVEENFGNKLIQDIQLFSKEEFKNAGRFLNPVIPVVKIQEKPVYTNIDLEISDNDLEKISVDNCLALTLNEMQFIKEFYQSETLINNREKLGLPSCPTDLELEVIAQTWSEHCRHKIFAANIDYKESEDCVNPIGTKNINSLYKTYVKNATNDIKEKRNLSWLISVFSDNAGVVRFDENIDLCIKAETHNSPSALDPYGGALTGILGVNRDILGVGLGAKPICNTDVFCFGPTSWPKPDFESYMPLGLMEPKRLLKGVHKGIEDGGNKSGVPTVNGAILFDADYSGKPLVFCGTVGTLPQNLKDGREGSSKGVKVGDAIFMVGGEIGADGVHGATFSSLELNESSPATAVQIGDPLTQRRVWDFLIKARDLGLYTAITDNGAGGLSSSVGEMATLTNGADIDLSKCPTKYPGLTPWELMISESQERMTVSVAPENIKEFELLSNRMGVTSSNIGNFHDLGYLNVSYKETLVGQLDLHFLHEALPQMQLKATWSKPQSRTNWMPIDERVRWEEKDLEGWVHSVLSRENVASKEEWVRQFDHEVQGSTHIKPFSSDKKSSPNNSGVVWLYPHGGEKENAISVGCGIAPRISLSDPYEMARFAVDEAVRNVVSNGGDIDNLCLLDNFCWPDPVQSEKNQNGEYRLGQLVRTCSGLYDICMDYGTPLVSGKDSMKNDFRGKNKSGDDLAISVLPTLLVTSMAKTNITNTTSTEFKNEGDFIFVLGNNSKGLEGSELAEICHIPEETKKLPLLDSKFNYKLYKEIFNFLQTSEISSIHDISDGGLITSICESTFCNDLGVDIAIPDLDSVELMDYLFNESPGKFLISIKPENKIEFESTFKNFNLTMIGKVKGSSVDIECNKKKILSTPITSLYNSWNKDWGIA